MPPKLGQHFLVRETILEELAAAACGDHTERIIEIGPGRGALTRHLLRRTDDLHAIEIDPKLAAYLTREFMGVDKLHVHHANVLDVDLKQWGPAAIAGNLPYYITSPIIEKFLALDVRFSTAVFLVQWEVAQRLLAKPGTRDYGYLTVSTQIVCDAELVCKVPPEAFSPPPKVDSAGVRLLKKRERTEELKPLLQFVGRCFAHKRKTLRNNLIPFHKEAIESLPEAQLRAEQLTIEQFRELYVKVNS